MGYFISRLSGKAHNQVKGSIDVETGHINFADVGAVRDVLRVSFGDIDEKSTAAQDIFIMKQGHKALSDFLPLWEESASIITWNDDAKIDLLRRQLHPAITDRLSFERIATTIPAFLAQVREKDAILRNQEPHYHKNLSTANPNLSSSSHDARAQDMRDPMDLSAFRVNGVLTWTSKDVETKKIPRSDEERAARKAYNSKHNLCQWDSSKDHAGNDCPFAPWNRDKEFYKGKLSRSDDYKGKA